MSEICSRHRQIGDMLQDRYRIECWLGAGGMGGVYQAVHEGLDAVVAIKQLTLRVDADDEFAMVRQFCREAGILHRLQHQNLPRVHDIFREDGSWYLVMDYIDGQTIDQLMETRVIDEKEMLTWAEALCGVLHYLHSHQPPVIFRDLKPSNVMLTRDGQLKLIDFGLAKTYDLERGFRTHTSARGAATPGFAAPEQYGSGTDVKTDIYALGATLYCILTGRVPPESTAIAAGMASVIPLRDIRPDITPTTIRIIEWMMSIPRPCRPDSIRQVADALGFSTVSPRTRRLSGGRLPNSGSGTALRLAAAAGGVVQIDTQPVRRRPSVAGVRGQAPASVPPPQRTLVGWSPAALVALGVGAMLMGAAGYRASSWHPVDAPVAALTHMASSRPAPKVAQPSGRPRAIANSTVQ